jgi:hypothetical protein
MPASAVAIKRADAATDADADTAAEMGTEGLAGAKAEAVGASVPVVAAAAWVS